MNEFFHWFGGDYEVVMKDIRKDIMCIIIEEKFATGDDKQKKRL